MKKIMFNDKYGLTKAVLEGRKTMTRRPISERVFKKASAYRREYFNDTLDAISAEGALLEFSRLKVGEVVAVAQAYKDTCWTSPVLRLKDKRGWSNKMFVYAGLMPHHIRITNVRVERMQDISDEDVYREGFSREVVNNGWGNAASHWETMLVYYDSLGRTKEIRSPYPRESFATLIDRLSGKGTWESNPWVFVYEFELVK